MRIKPASAEGLPAATSCATLPPIECPTRMTSVCSAVMTAVALVLAGVIVWQYLLLLVPALGMLTFAVVAIHERRLSLWSGTPSA